MAWVCTLKTLSTRNCSHQNDSYTYTRTAETEITNTLRSGDVKNFY